MRKRIGILWMAILLAAAGCGKVAGDEAGATAIGESGMKTELEKVSLVLDWYPNAVHQVFYAGMEKGFYEEEGIRLEILFPSGTSDGLSMPAVGAADLGLYYMHDVIMAAADQDVPVKTIGTLVQAPLAVVMSLGGQEIYTPADLEGKTLGHEGSALSEAKIQAMLDCVKVSGDQVAAVDVGFDLMSSMTTGQVDATIGCLINHDVPQLEEEGFPVNYFLVTEYGIPDYYELVFVIGEEQLLENPEKYERFLRATNKAYEYMAENPEEALQILLQNQNAENFPLSETVEEKSSAYLAAVYAAEGHSFLDQDKAVWEENIQWMKERGLIKGEITADEIVAELDWIR